MSISTRFERLSIGDGGKNVRRTENHEPGAHAVRDAGRLLSDLRKRNESFVPAVVSSYRGSLVGREQLYPRTRRLGKVQPCFQRVGTILGPADDPSECDS